jgi:hypothetical protein
MLLGRFSRRRWRQVLPVTLFVELMTLKYGTILHISAECEDP